MSCIAILNDSDNALREACALAGTLRILNGFHELNAKTDHLVMVDCRSAGLNYLLKDAYLSKCNVPVIAVVNKRQKIPKNLTASFVQELVTFEDLSSTAFQWRLKQQLDSVRHPLIPNTHRCETLRLMCEVTDNVTDWVIVKDLEHRFLFVCKGFADTVGLSRDEILGKNDLEIGTDPEAVHGNPATGWKGFWAQDDAVIEAGVPVVEENLNWRAFVINRRYKRTVRKPLKNAQGEIYALLVTTSDITNRVLAERNLKARNLMLRRVTEEKKNAEAHRQIAEQAVRAKNKFLAAASHDLRQPLHALGLFLSVLEKRLSNPNELAILAKARLSSEAMNTLFNSLLDISRLDAGVVEVHAHDFPISELLTSIRDEFTQLGNHKNLEVAVDIRDDVVHTDPALFGRIIRNLIQNAITHTEEGSITVSCHQTDERFFINIADTGPGIPEEEHRAVFDEYYQLNDSSTRATRGLGLGLAIVSRMSRLLDVKISMQSVVGKGSRFTVGVAMGNLQTIPQPRKKPDFNKLAGLEVLLIDDESDIRQGLQLMLEAYHCKCLAADSASEALAMLRRLQREPDIMIIDYQLRHGLKGDAAIRQIREQFQRTIPAIIVTGDTSKKRLQDAKRCDSRLLHKPVEAAALLDAISAKLEESIGVD